ncbi:thioester domain-containing protein [Nocardiopsis coralliicola]
MIETTIPHSAPRRGRRAAAFAAATTAAALAFGFSGAPALASGAKGVYDGTSTAGQKVSVNGSTIGTSVFDLTLEDGTVLKTYCIDYETNIRKGAAYQEDAWANYPGKGSTEDAGKVHWILQNSFPKVDVATLAEATKIEGLTQEQAIAGTQAAIWHFSNGVELDKGKDGNVDALYDSLVENAQDQEVEEPQASLTITPGSAEGTAGETIGEFTVATSADSVPLTLDAPEGVQLVDLESGEPVEEVANGDTFGFQVAEDAEAGQASVSGTVSATVEVGRLFKGAEGEEATQTLITAAGKSTEVTAGASVSWAASEGGETPPPPEETETPEEPSPSPSAPEETDKPDDKPAPEKDEDQGGLPVTGSALTALIGAAVAAVAGGGAAMYLSRKRRSAVDEA